MSESKVDKKSALFLIHPMGCLFFDLNKKERLIEIDGNCLIVIVCTSAKVLDSQISDEENLAPET